MSQPDNTLQLAASEPPGMWLCHFLASCDMRTDHGNRLSARVQSLSASEYTSVDLTLLCCWLQTACCIIWAAPLLRHCPTFWCQPTNMVPGFRSSASAGALPIYALISKPDIYLLTSAGGLLHHLGNPLGVSLPHSLTLSDTHLDTRGYRSSANAQVSANQLSHISTAQLLPNAFPSLYASNPGAMLGSGQAAHQALGSQNHSSLNANLNATSAQTQRYLAGSGMGQVNIAAVLVYLL